MACGAKQTELFLIAAFALVMLASTPARSEPPDAMASYLEARARSQPDNASDWRLLGQYRLQHDDCAGAAAALERAVTLDPDRIAAQFDLGRALLAAGRKEEAARHLYRCIRLAPDSSYAADARQLCQGLPDPEAEDSQVIQASFEVNRFERPSAGVAPPPPPQQLNFWMEAGTIYNSNVQLAPISRELFPQERAGPQGYVAPHLEYTVPLAENWRAGPLFHGYFNLNPSNLDQFDLQHYQPGVFLERSIFLDAVELRPRVQYDFSYDAFGGDPFGTRHALTPSLTANWSPQQQSVLFWTIDYTRFNDEGIFPANTSRNGWTNTLGLSHAVQPDLPLLRLLRGGVEAQIADLVGSDFSYRGIYCYAEARFPFVWGSVLGLQGGIGYRDFFESTMTPSRNETIWRAGLEVRKDFNEHWSAATLFTYDRFDSANPLFNANRYIAGVTLTYRY